MKRIFLVFITVVLVMAATGCSLILKQTAPVTSQEKTSALLDIHSAMCPQIPFNRDTAKIIMFSDLHRGMGEKDVFKNNKELFSKILDYYNNNGYTLVLIGDCEEGWGFQRDNIPLILKAHAAEFEIEKNFLADNRYHRVYGNHDDFFRGQLINFEELGLKKVYPAIFFHDQEKKFKIFITHGSQGQGLHDAGDELAACAVYFKYYWLLDISSNKFKSKMALKEKVKATIKSMERHEKMVYEWALKDNPTKKKICNILVTGHTHIPVFNSCRSDIIFRVIKDELKNGEYMFFNDIFEKEPRSMPSTADTLKMEIPGSFKEEMIDHLEWQIDNAKDNVYLFADVKGKEPVDPFYFNTGCGFHSKITCIEISGGKIYLKLLSFDNYKNIVFEIKGTADLQNF